MKKIPNAGAIIAIFIALTILVAVGPILTKDNDSTTDGVQSTITEYSSFGIDVVNQTVGQAGPVKLIPDSAIPFLIIGAMLLLGAAVFGYNMLGGNKQKGM